MMSPARLPIVWGLLTDAGVWPSLPTGSPPGSDQHEVNEQPAYSAMARTDRTSQARRSHHETV